MDEIEEYYKEIVHTYLEEFDGRYGVSVDVEFNRIQLFMTSEPGSETPRIGALLDLLSREHDFQTPFVEDRDEGQESYYSIIDLNGAIP